MFQLNNHGKLRTTILFLFQLLLTFQQALSQKYQKQIHQQGCRIQAHPKIQTRGDAAFLRRNLGQLLISFQVCLVVGLWGLLHNSISFIKTGTNKLHSLQKMRHCLCLQLCFAQFQEYHSPASLHRFECFYDSFPKDGCKHKHLEEDARICASNRAGVAV